MWRGLLLVCAVVSSSACAQEASQEDLPFTTSLSETSNAGSTERFRDPQGTYTIDIDESWSERPGTLVEEIEVWQVGPTEDGFAPNVNVLTQAAPNLDLEEYVELSRESADEVPGIEVIEAFIVDGAHGQPLGIMEYTGRQGSTHLSFLGVFAVNDGRAIVATLTAPAAVFEELASDVRPLLLTLEITSS